jgi:hypothetical protein
MARLAEGVIVPVLRVARQQPAVRRAPVAGFQGKDASLDRMARIV